MSKLKLIMQKGSTQLFKCDSIYYLYAICSDNRARFLQLPAVTESQAMSLASSFAVESKS